VSHECQEGDEHGLKWEHEHDDLDPHPTNRAGRPEDIASAVEFVADAGFMTGQDVTLGTSFGIGAVLEILLMIWVVDGGALRMKNKA
jgi:NAD(P)-dependent dehydrogenase (short-subunit alcohol dehydrogenase family)